MLCAARRGWRVRLVTTGDGAGYEAEAALVKDAINTKLFNGDTGIYDISNELSGPTAPVAQDANAMAVLFRVAPPELRASILQRTAAALDTPNGPLAFSPGSTILSQIISPFISSFETWARFQTGDAAGALALIRKVWGHMRQGSAYYSGGIWEALAPDGTPPPARALAALSKASPTAGHPARLRHFQSMCWACGRFNPAIRPG